MIYPSGMSWNLKLDFERMIQVKQIWKIEGMSCEHCVRRVFNGLIALDGVSKVEVDLDSATATMETETLFTAEQATAIVDDLGYDFAGLAE